eukprot:1057321-Pyramimonas_sp.AAC.1
MPVGAMRRSANVLVSARGLRPKPSGRCPREGRALALSLLAPVLCCSCSLTLSANVAPAGVGRPCPSRWRNQQMSQCHPMLAPLM